MGGRSTVGGRLGLRAAATVVLALAASVAGGSWATPTVAGSSERASETTWSGTFRSTLQESTVSTYEDGDYTRTVTASVSGTLRPAADGSRTLASVVVKSYEERWHYPDVTCRWRTRGPVRYDGVAVLAEQAATGYDFGMTIVPDGGGSWPVTELVPDCTKGTPAEAVHVDLDSALRTCVAEEFDASLPVLPLPAPAGGRITGDRSVACELDEDFRRWTSTTTSRADLVSGGAAAQAADLSVRLTGLDRRTRVGRVDKVRAVVANAGPDAARSVRLRLTLPRGTRLVGLTGGGCERRPGRAVDCRVDRLAAGGSTAAVLRLRAVAPERRARLAARVSAATADPDDADNRTGAVQRITGR